MKLATLRTTTGTIAARIEADRAVEIAGSSDVGELLTDPDWHRRASTAQGPVAAFDRTRLAPVVPTPGKIICVGLNYRHHIKEMGRDLPEHPTLFTKYPESLVGARDVITMPPESTQVDWEGELAVIVGTRIRRAGRAEATSAIAGYSVLNDITMRDYQYRTLQWFQGKSWEASTPFGPVLVTPDELPGDGTLQTAINDEVVQRTTIDDLVFDAPSLIGYISTILTLNPGDVIATGTPGGVGHARDPARYVSSGDTVTTSISGIGELVNCAVSEHVVGAGQ